MIFDFRDISRAMQESTSSQCPACLLRLKNLKSMKKHMAVCSIKICREDVEPDRKVRDNEESERLIAVLSKSKPTYRQLINICEQTGTALPGLFPFFFPKKHSPPILSNIGCVHNSYAFLQKSAQEGPVRLQKTIKVKVGNSIIALSQNLLPSSPRELKRRGLKVIDKGIVYHSSNPVSICFLNCGNNLS